MNEYFWELVQFDGTRLEVPPNLVDLVRSKLAAGQPISTRSMVIPANQVRTFRKTDKVYTDQKLLRESAQAFDEPIIREVEDYGQTYSVIDAKWVKKQVTQRQWDQYFSAGNYRRLGDAEDGMVTVAFRLATHTVDLTKVQYCTPEEVERLDKHK